MQRNIIKKEDLRLDTTAYVAKKLLHIRLKHMLLTHLEACPLCMKVTHHWLKKKTLALVLEAVQG